MIYLYIYIALAIIFAIYHTYTYSKTMVKIDPRVDYVGKGTKAILIILTFLISVILAPLIVFEKIHAKFKGEQL